MNPNTIILDGGDLIQGSALAALSEGSAFSSIVKAMNYDFLIPGNWEVVYLSYNDPEVPIRQNPTFSKGLDFDPILENLEQLVNELKDEQGVDILFLVTHIGISKQFDLANNPALARIDYVFGNDTHERIRKPLQANHARVTEPGAFASFVGKMVLEVQNGTILKEDYELLEVDPSKYKKDTLVAAVIQEAIAPYEEEIEQVLGYTKTPLYRYFVVENPMDNFITDASMWKNDVDIALSNGFRFSPPIVPNETGVAPITRGDLWKMLPVDNKLKIGWKKSSIMYSQKILKNGLVDGLFDSQECNSPLMHLQIKENGYMI